MHFTKLLLAFVSFSVSTITAQSLMTAPAAACSSLTTFSPTIEATASAADGTPPYTYKLYRSKNCNLNTNADQPQLANDPSAELVDKQTGLGAGVVPHPYTDKSPPQGFDFYSWVVTDSASSPHTAAGFNVGVVVPSPVAKVRILAIGDSIGLGHDCSKFIQQIVNIQVTAPGSGYTRAAAEIPAPTGPNGVQATAACHIANGQIDYIYWTNPGWGYNAEKPLAVTISGDGVGANGLAYAGGGPVLACQQILQDQFGYKTLSVYNCCVGGTAAYSWWPASRGAHHYTDSARATVGNPSDIDTIVYIRFGANDSTGLASPEAFKSNMEFLIKDYLAWGAKKIILDPPLWWSGAGNFRKQYLLQQYGVDCRALAQSDPGRIVCTNSSNYSFFYAHPEHLFVDHVHPVDSGYAILGAVMASTIAQIISLEPPATIPETVK